MDNMRVLILPSWYFAKGTAQLRGRMFHQHAVALRKKGIDARILYGEFNMAQSFVKRANRTVEENIPTWRVTQWFPPKANGYVTKLWIKKYALAVEDYISKEGRPDIIHAQSYLTGAVAFEIKKKLNLPYVYTERLSSFLSGQVPVRYLPLIRMTLDHSNLNTAVSPGLQKQLQSFTQNSIEVVPNFYDPEIFYADPTIKKYKTFSWVTVGEPADIKGLDILLEAYGELRNRIGIKKMQL